MNEEIEDVNPEIVTYKTEEGKLIIEKTHKTPKVNIENYSIAELQGKIARINNVISIWEAKKKPYQDLINKYNEIVEE